MHRLSLTSLFTFRRCRQNKSKRYSKDGSTAEEGITPGCTDKSRNSNRAEEDITSIQSLSNFEIESIFKTKSTASKATQTEISTTEKDSPRRKRLTGYSMGNPEDTNNNLGATQPMISSKARNVDVTVQESVSDKFSNSATKFNNVDIVWTSKPTNQPTKWCHEIAKHRNTQNLPSHYLSVSCLYWKTNDILYSSRMMHLVSGNHIAPFSISYGSRSNFLISS